MSTLMREVDNSDLPEFMDIDANLDTEDGHLDNVLLDNFQNESQNSDDEEHETEIPKIDDYEKTIVAYKDGLLEIKKLKQFCSEKNDLQAFGMLTVHSLSPYDTIPINLLWAVNGPPESPCTKIFNIKGNNLCS
ncbi:hypothetical protein QE152_g25473 [Popillia japonica]|uniref:Uncharacterized protein n=1 Tax=Popillia japonica TaxID=7064 RepID=A0AAW1K1X1_POPJA